MPLVQISLLEGRSDELIKSCIKAVAEAVHQTLGSPYAAISVYAVEVPRAHWATGTRTKDEPDTAVTAQALKPGNEQA
ncbi:tautomerase family protein [Paraburkholderia sp. Ac-20347]|jgi:4-oxalocrotonate tautomerase|uniref:tautomerase family protein n=1 Tax=Paraburkholderia sp. Ac-20347 TaxID=2703892 RepID=UPI0019806C57|nr:tautomerase family protein [Paraburkholderia sp. Ac-20347]MBN3808074.1 4-oxalocrotonate tautomerase [Paraburkholderia sp. Ac-20347]